MSCVLRVSGADLDVASLLSEQRVQPNKVWHKGVSFDGAMRSKRTQHSSGFLLTVSQAGFEDFRAQESAALRFIDRHQTFLQRTQRFPGVDFFIMDFGVEFSREAPHSILFSKDFITAAAEVGLSLEISSYPI